MIGRVQDSVYQGGLYNNQSDWDYSVGVNLNYRINQHFAVDAGYNYDNVNSDLSGLGYTRNRVYLGLTADY